MKKGIMYLAVGLISLLVNTNVNAVTYTIFTENWEDGTWTGFSKSPGGQTGVVTTGETIYNAPPSGAPGTYMPPSTDGSLKNGKTWPLYWSPGDVTGNVFYANTNLADSTLRGAPITFTFDSYISSYDAPRSGTDLHGFIKFFNADYSYYYNWNGSSVITSLNSTLKDSWVSNTITTVIPFDAAVMQVGFGVSQTNYSDGSLNVDNMVVSVPEPSTVSLLGFGVAGLIATRLRRRI